MATDTRHRRWVLIAAPRTGRDRMRVRRYALARTGRAAALRAAAPPALEPR